MECAVSVILINQHHEVEAPSKILTANGITLRHCTERFQDTRHLKHITKHVILLSEKVTQSPNWVYYIHYHNDETPLLHK